MDYTTVYTGIQVCPGCEKDAGPCKGTGTHLVLLRPTLIRKYEKKGEKSKGNRNHSGRKGGSYSRKKKECYKKENTRRGGHFRNYAASRIPMTNV